MKAEGTPGYHLLFVFAFWKVYLEPKVKERKTADVFIIRLVQK
jgi:hypothetical protein